MNSVLNLILSHQPADAVARMLAHWSRYVSGESILIAYGGTKSEFDAIQPNPNLPHETSTVRGGSSEPPAERR